MATLSSWTRDGKPYTLCRPAADLKATFERHGYTVYHYPDPRHLNAIPPEDHTPFSATGWPGTSPYGWGMADDIMPHPDPQMPTMAQLGAKILADKRAGVAGLSWLKYMNWTDGNGACWNESWTPTYRRSGSSDRGHIHMSCRSDFYRSTLAAGYDPVAALMTPPPPEDDMTPEQATLLTALAWQMDAIIFDKDKIAGGPQAGVLNAFHARLGIVEAKADATIAAIGHIGSNSPEVATILAALEETKAELEAEIQAARAEARDAVGDALEGGVAQVRADA